MTTMLWVAGYVLGSLIVGRVAYALGVTRDPRDGVESLVVLMLVWPLILVVAAGIAPFAAAVWLVTRPTRAERRAARLRSAEEEWEHIRAEARRLGLPLVDDGSAS